MELAVRVLALRSPTVLQMTLDRQWQSSPLSQLRRSIVMQHDLMPGARFFVGQGNGEPLSEDLPCGLHAELILRTELSHPNGEMDPEWIEFQNVKKEIPELVQKQLDDGVSVEEFVQAVLLLVDSNSVLYKGMHTRDHTHNDGIRPVHFSLLNEAMVTVAERLSEPLTLPTPLKKRQHRLRELLLLQFAVGAAESWLLEWPCAARLCAMLPAASAPLSADQCISHVLTCDLTRMATQLVSEGRAITRGIFDRQVAQKLCAEARTIQASRLLRPVLLSRPGALPQGAVRKEYHEVDTPKSKRGDVIKWLDGCDASLPMLSGLVQWMRQVLVIHFREQLRKLSTGQCVLQHPSFLLQNAQFARYEGDLDAAFIQHVDNFGSGDDKRVVTIIIYLNDSWTEADGGALRLHSGEEGEFVDVIPEVGTMVIFWSLKQIHEVRPSSRTRHAISMWISVDELQDISVFDFSSTL